MKACTLDAPAAARSSFSVSGPSVLNTTRPSGASTRANSRNAGSGSGSQCSAMLHHTRSIAPAASGKRPSSAHTRAGFLPKKFLFPARSMASEKSSAISSAFG
ncbi:hypothetical protein D3C83_38180 [compost metagenome]